MRSKYSNIVVLLAAILAFAPVVAVNYLLDSYVRQRQSMLMQHAVDNISAAIEASANDEVGSLRRILARQPLPVHADFYRQRPQ